MTYAANRRLDFIDHRLLTHGQLERADIERTFGVSNSQASGDIQAFLAAHRGAMKYDKSMRRYVPRKQPYESRRGWTPARIEAWEAAGRAKVPGVWSDHQN